MICLRKLGPNEAVRCWAAVAFAALTLQGAPALAGPRETFQSGNEAFWSGDFAGAVQAYQELVDQGIADADVLFNLGTASARLGQYGRAIVNYERALRLRPGDEGARENLAVVRRSLARRETAEGQDADLEPPRSFGMNFVERVSVELVLIPFLVCYVLFFAVLAARRLLRGEVARLVLFVGAVVAGVGGLAGGAVSVGKVQYERGVREAVVVSQGGTIVREGPGERFAKAFVAREGERLQVVEEGPEWLFVRGRGDREGWGKKGEVEQTRISGR